MCRATEKMKKSKSDQAVRARAAQIRLASERASKFLNAPGGLEGKLAFLFENLEEIRACKSAMCTHCIEILCKKVLPE